MTVSKIPIQAHHYVGASTDTKPTAATHDTPIGSTFFEHDTGILYITYDGTNWVEIRTTARLVDSGGTDITEITHHSMKVLEQFGGNVYSKTMTMTNDAATRFETTAKKLRDAVIIVTTNNMLLGKSGTEVYPVDADDTVGFTRVDLSTLYFKNAVGGSNGTITILGVEE